MNTQILHTEVQDYIFKKSETNIDLTKLILSGIPFDNVSPQELAQQINGRLKAKKKLPIWSQTKGIYYPPTLNLEQTSSAATAIYKSSLVSGDLLIDLTGGFGIDAYYFSKKITQVIHCELNAELNEIASHNFKVLGSTSVKTILGDGLKTLENLSKAEWIYIDPSRRNDNKGKVFFMEDCLPNVPKNLDFLFSKSNKILIKTSPLLDIRAGLNSLEFVKEIHVVAVQNEVKELLWVLEKNIKDAVMIKSINIIDSHSQKFSFLLENENNISAELSLPKKYLYEPNAAIMKAGGFKSVTRILSAQKLHQHSHLYTSNELIIFPGRSFQIISILPYRKQVLKKEKFIKANITTRNFPESVSEIRKKFKIKDGGDIFLFFTINCLNERVVLVCKKIRVNIQN
ncbi:THUMP-like domain-containing protein [Aquimarina sp. M1]